MVARTGKTPECMVFWYNNTPNSVGIIPAAVIHAYHPRLPRELVKKELERDLSAKETGTNSYKIGDNVFVKPGKVRCDTKWKQGTVTKLISDKVVEIDRVNRHVADVRLVRQNEHDQNDAISHLCTEVDIEPCGNAGLGINEEVSDESAGNNSDLDGSEICSWGISNPELVDEPNQEEGGRTTRDRRPPPWMANFYIN